MAPSTVDRPTIARDLCQLIADGHKFRTVLADPPWRYDNTASRGAAANHYNILSWVLARRTVHSRKPFRFRELIEQVSPGPYLELYGREEQPNTDWTVYGNQVERRLF